METFKFITKISKNGLIQIPFKPVLFNKEVEITIVPKIGKLKEKRGAKDFINKWAGFLKDSDVDDEKYKYLMEKYK